MRLQRLSRDMPEALARVASGAVVLASSAGAVSCPADTNEDVLATILIPANVLGPNGSIEVETYWTHTSSANNKTLKIKLGATALASIVLTTLATSVLRAVGMNRGATNSQYSASIHISPAAIAQAASTAAIDTTADVSLTITGTKASAGETITLEAYTVRIIPG